MLCYPELLPITPLEMLILYSQDIISSLTLTRTTLHGRIFMLDDPPGSYLMGWPVQEEW